MSLRLLKHIENRDKLMLKFLIVFLLLVGLSIIFWNYNANQKVQTYTSAEKTVTVIRLPQKDSYVSVIPYVVGMALCSISVILFFNVYPHKPKAAIKENLTEQERIIVDLIEKGRRNKEIAKELSISHSTVKTHINNIYKKMGINSREELLSKS